MMGVAVGIDLGSTKSVVAVAGKPGETARVLCETETPAIVAEGSNGEIIVGRRAAFRRHHGAVTCARRDLGYDKTFSLPHGTVVRAEDAVSLLLKDLKETAEQELAETVDRAVIAFPAFWTCDMLQELHDAAGRAGFTMVRLVHEPIATVTACYANEDPQPRRVLIYDLGGGKFDAAVVDIRDGDFRIVCLNGDRQLGGREFDRRIANWFWEQLRADGYDLPAAPSSPADDRIYGQLLQHAEQAKIRLSAEASAHVSAIILGEDRTADPFVLDLRVKRAEFEQMIAPDVDRTFELCRHMLQDAGRALDELDDVLLVGGSSSIPFVRQRVHETFRREPRQVHPLHCVALGAALLASRHLQSWDSTTGDVPHAAYVATLSQPIEIRFDQGLREIIPAGVRLPFETTLQLSLSGNARQLRLPLFQAGESIGEIQSALPENRSPHSVLEITLHVDSNSLVSATLRYSDTNWQAPAQREGRHVLHSGSQEVPVATIDRVHFSVTSPTCVQPGAAFILDVWAHLEQQRTLVLERAQQAQGGRDLVVQSKGPVSVARGTVLTVRLQIDRLVVSDPDDTILWAGEIGNARFRVDVPQDAAVGQCPGLAVIYADGLRIAKLAFHIPVGEQMAATGSIPLKHDRHRRAFASYAREDFDQVLGRLQGMQKACPNLTIFLDVLALRSGQNWEQELYQEIARSDVFYLFWSQYARDSEWVDREWHCALERRGIDFIDPVPLVDPTSVPPPPELATKHFNDWVLAFLIRSR